MSTHLGSAIRAHRLDAALTQDRLAALTGTITRQRLRRIEAGACRVMVGDAVAISNALGVPIYVLLRDAGYPEPLVATAACRF